MNYIQIDDFVAGLAKVKSNNKIGVIDEYDNIVIECKYDDIDNFYNGLAIVTINDKYGFVNTLGEEICEIKYTDVCDFIDTVTWVSLDLSWGLINNKGEELCEFKYNDMTIFIAGFSKVEINHDLGSYYGYVDKNGIEIIQCKYDSNTADILLQKYKLNLKRKSKIKSFLS